MKKGILISIVVLVILLGVTYAATIKEGWYLTCNDGVETHWFYKTDAFGNKWITGCRTFYM